MSSLPTPSRSKNQFIYDFSVYKYSSKSDAEQMVEKIRTVLDDARTNEQFKEIQLELLWRSLESTDKKVNSKACISEQEKAEKKARKKAKKQAKKEKIRLREERGREAIIKPTRRTPSSYINQVATKHQDTTRQPIVHRMALQPASKKQVTPWPTWAQVKANKVVAVPKEAAPVETPIHEPELEAVALTNVLIQSTVQNPKLEVEVKASSSFEISEKTKVEPVVSSAATPKLETFRWPSTVAYEADESMPESNWPKLGMLSAVGYCVGINGLGLKQRQELLSNVYSKRLPFVDSRKYVAEWGAPKSSERLKKLAEAIAAFVRNAKRKKNNMSVAIREWQQDLAWLKEKYYLQHKFVWVWPKSALPNEEIEKLQITEALEDQKVYASSREFLVEQYVNDANELCCQICQSALPFKLGTGEYYFEEISVHSHAKKSSFSDLLFCPNHRAMYQHANDNEVQLLEALGSSFQKDLKIMLANKKHKIFVTEKHQVELRKLRSELSDITFEFVHKSLLGVSKVHLYELGGKWILSSKADVKLSEFTSSQEAKEWLKRFDAFRKRESPTQIKETRPQSRMKRKTGAGKVTHTSKSPILRLGSIKKSVTQSSYKTGFTTCSNCRGDGGINGGCWKCGGSGWM
ncbi:hypothetical protein [Vibrio harveyi]|uniref:hypothetical protein n=1 Tax=Vibrio harveyi TaxID=669 RepID=UPI002380B866|nr:hypothetical protein [Vibrio harveyi]